MGECVMHLDNDARTDTEPQFRELFSQYRQALHILEEVFAPFDQPSAINKMQEVVFAHCTRIVQMLRSILLLARFGQGMDCVILTRSLVEHTINAYYLFYEKRRKGLYPYLKYGRIEQWENYRKLVEFQEVHKRQPTIEQLLGPERVRTMRCLHSRTRKDFLDRKGELRPCWSKLNLRQRAEFVDQHVRAPGRMEELYVVVTQQMGNPLTHGSAYGLSQIPSGEDGARFDASPSAGWVSECLHIGLACVFLTGQLANLAGRMGRDNLIRRLEATCRPSEHVNGATPQ